MGDSTSTGRSVRKRANFTLHLSLDSVDLKYGGTLFAQYCIGKGVEGLTMFGESSRLSLCNFL